jgi:AAA family ATP:ADP antiporter
MTSVRARLSSVFDIRQGEGRVALGGFAVILLLIITAHTILETARDALLLVGPGPRALGIVYMAIAICALPAGALAGRLAERVGVARGLALILAVAAAAPLILYVVPTSAASVMGIYVVSGVIASVVVPQFWMLVGTALTVAQGRRLFGLISSAAVLGGVLGSGTAAAAIQVFPARVLLLLSATIFAGGAVLVGLRKSDRTPAQRATRRPSVQSSFRAIREQPFLGRIALLVVLSTATVLLIDCFFKWSIVRAVPTARVGTLVARYYLALNVASLGVQVFLGSAIVRRLGVAAAVVVTPLLLFFGMLAAVVGGGSLIPVLLVKGIDGSLRHSLHRITGELVYLPIPSGVRSRAKPLVDGALARATQSVASAGFLAASGAALLSPRTFAAGIAVLAAGWLLAAVTLRKPYLGLLRRALSTGSLSTQESPDPLDLETAEVLIQHLASADPLEVVGAMRALSRRGHAGFISALVLLHRDEAVVTEGLRVLGASTRTDWIPLARNLLTDPRDSIRIEAVRAVGTLGSAAQLADDPAPRVRGYCAVSLAIRDNEADALEHPRVVPLLRGSARETEAARYGMLTAVADSPRTRRLSSLLVELSARTGESAEETELLARAVAQQSEMRLVPKLVGLLSRRAGRDAVRSALVALGEPAFDEIWRRLTDPAPPRSLRMHLPKSLARFGSARAADCLLTSIETEPDRLVRYKSIRALEALVDEHPITVDLPRVERLSHSNLVEHFQILGLRAALDPTDPARGSPATASRRLLFGLLDDKLRHALERAFRLLKIAYPKQQIRRAYLACLSDDPYARANAVEFLDTLLRRRRHDQLRSLLCLAADDLPTGQRVSRAASITLDDVPRAPEDALARLVEDADPTVAALAALYASELELPGLRLLAGGVLRAETDMVVTGGEPFDGLSSSRAGPHA